ncbi:MAG: fumarate hydratase C-terminal domain-containing protein [Candidatus Methanomethylophilaceae archaeon]|nr:fumarate hydratase C-terminal domain-containing protein [Candidatus Methanomethylophilaceae archaeon]
MRILESPLSEETVRSLKLGEIVYINGPVITGRDEMHIRAIEKAEKGEATPGEIEGSVLYHCGPIMTEIDGKKCVVAAGPTTSARMNSLESRMISKFHIRAIIGKGGMSSDVGSTMAREGCVYLAATGGAAVTLAEGLAKVEGVEWEDLGMAEAMWKFRANKLGPLIVAMDANGNSLYDRVNESLRR